MIVLILLFLAISLCVIYLYFLHGYSGNKNIIESKPYEPNYFLLRFNLSDERQVDLLYELEDKCRAENISECSVIRYGPYK